MGMRMRDWRYRLFIDGRLLEQQRHISDLQRQVKWLQDRCVGLRSLELTAIGVDSPRPYWESEDDELAWHRENGIGR
jgi:hypothetical protein